MTTTIKHELYISQYRAGMSLKKIADADGTGIEAVRDKLRYYHKEEYKELAGQKVILRKQMHRQRLNELMSFIIGYKRQHDGCSPTIREMVANTSYTSTSVLIYSLNRLEKEGKIKYSSENGESRRIMVVGGKWTYSADTTEVNHDPPPLTIRQRQV